MNILSNVKGSFIKGRTPIVENKCMSCGKVIDKPEPGLDGRRFCSPGCKKEYMG